MGKFTQLDIELMNVAEEIERIANQYNIPLLDLYKYLECHVSRGKKSNVK